jgi:hypothetical protein
MKNVISSVALLSVLQSEKKNSGGTFVLQSLKTGKDYTYQIARKKFGQNWYTQVSVEVGYLNFQRIGTYFRGKIYHSKQEVTAPSALAIAWVLRKVEEGQIDLLDSCVEISHTGNCLRCGQTLTDAQSIGRGLGPVCSQKK